MNFYPETQIVEILVPFTDASGQSIVPTAITAVLWDGEDQMLLDFGSVVFDSAGVEAKIIVPAIANTLQGDELQEVRRLEVTLAHASGSAKTSKSYVIEAEQSLQIMRNSFMTYDTALMTSTQFVNLTAFVTAPDERRRAALVEAFHRITDLPMIYSVSSLPVAQDVTTSDGLAERVYKVSRATWRHIDADAFQTQFPSHFKRALRAAQLAEADDLLQGNVIARKHAQGIATETIGESSVSLRQGFGSGVSAGIGTAALALLSGYIDRTMKVGRA
jgi:hypothetical protein